MSDALLATLSAVGPFAIAVVLVVVGLLSQRLGAVTRTPPYYRWFFVAAGLAGVSVVLRLLLYGVRAEAQSVVALLYTATLALSVTLGVIVAWYYWRWLFSERGR